MNKEEFPPNSDKNRLGEYEDSPEKNIKQVTSTPAVRRKKSVGRQFKEIFFGGDARSALSYTVLNVVIPGAKELLFDTGREYLEKRIFGDTRRRGGGTPMSGPGGYVSYNRYAMGGQQQQERPRTMSPRGRSRHNFDEIVLETRQEASDVIDSLFEIVGQYGSVSVADLYELVGIQSTHADQKWGWDDLRGADVSRVRGGHLLDLPNPEPLN